MLLNKYVREETKMTEDLKHYLYVVFTKLSFDERREIIAYLKENKINLLLLQKNG